ncbi:sce7726 family protein [Chloroflexota bacterium]
MGTLKDRDIRLALIARLRELYANDPHTIILQEFGLFEHRVRIDLAIVNGSMFGFEIKSDADTLERLPYQQEIYSKIFDRVTIVVGESQLSKIETIVPKWWGIWVAWNDAHKVGLRIAREPSDNRNVDSRALVRCLWKQEALEIIKVKCLYEKKLDKARRSVLWDILVDLVPISELRRLVCDCLKKRDGWRIVLPQELNGDSPQLRPIL